MDRANQILSPGREIVLKVSVIFPPRTPPPRPLLSLVSWSGFCSSQQNNPQPKLGQRFVSSFQSLEMQSTLFLYIMLVTCSNVSRESNSLGGKSTIYCRMAKIKFQNRKWWIDFIFFQTHNLILCGAFILDTYL